MSTFTLLMEAMVKTFQEAYPSDEENVGNENNGSNSSPSEGNQPTNIDIEEASHISPDKNNATKKKKEPNINWEKFEKQLPDDVKESLNKLHKYLGLQEKSDTFRFLLGLPISNWRQKKRNKMRSHCYQKSSVLFQGSLSCIWNQHCWSIGQTTKRKMLSLYLLRTREGMEMFRSLVKKVQTYKKRIMVELFVHFDFINAGQFIRGTSYQPIVFTNQITT